MSLKLSKLPKLIWAVSTALINCASKNLYKTSSTLTKAADSSNPHFSAEIRLDAFRPRLSRKPSLPSLPAVAFSKAKPLCKKEPCTMQTSRIISLMPMCGNLLLRANGTQSLEVTPKD